MALYELHEEARRDGLYDLDQHSEKLRRELETGKFTILVSNIASVLCVRPVIDELTLLLAGTRRVGRCYSIVYGKSALSTIC